MNVTDNDNPARVRPFDNTALAELPEYQRAADALNDLIHAANRAETGLGQDRWLTAVRDLAAAIPFMDACSNCRNTEHAAAPAAVELDDTGWMNAAYQCHSCGHRWTCGWSTSAPNFL